MDARLDVFIYPEHHDLGNTCKPDIRTTAQALLHTSESFPGATLQLVSRHIDIVPASLGLTSAGHAVVGVLRKPHTVPGGSVTRPDPSTLGPVAATSLLCRQHGASFPIHSCRDNDRQGRSNDGPSSSSHSKRAGQTKNRCEDWSGGGGSSSSAPARWTRLETEERADSEDVTDLKTPRQVTPSCISDSPRSTRSDEWDQ